MADRGYLQRRGSVVGQNGYSECVSTAVRTHGWLQCWYYCAPTWLAAVLVSLCVHMAGCSVLVLLCVHMAGFSVGTTVRTHGWLQC